MIAEIGHFALILALAIALVQGLAPLYGAQRHDFALMALAGPAAVGQLMAVTVAFGALTHAYVVSDFTILNVALNSHSAKPMLYKISGVWGNHEGSILLWALILATFGAAVAVFGRNLPGKLRARVLSIQALIACGFLLFSLLTSNPFRRVFPPPIDGNGLNPLLQDPGLAFHPPFLYLGYVGFSIAFSFAVAALIEGRIDAAWGRWVRPWTLAAWCFLTLGIALGSWWAYYELGWGGWWFWDPVENASFMPWLAGTALLHSAIVVEKRNALKGWTVLLAIITFSLSLLGTFLVRSGVLTSVHAFATDPRRGIFILGFLAVVIGGSLLLYAIRASALKRGGLFAPISREGGLVVNNLLLSTALAMVLLGTLYPLFLDAVAGVKITVGPPWFNFVCVVVMVPLVLLMGIGPLLSWKRADIPGVLTRLRAAVVASVIVALGVWYVAGDAPVAAILGMALGVWLLAASLVQLAERTRLFRAPPGDSLRRAIGLPLAFWGMTFAHIGLAVAILGITASTSWQSERLQIMKAGDTVEAGGYEFRFQGAEPIAGPNYRAQKGHFLVTRDGRTVAELRPESRQYPVPPMETTEAAIHSMISGDLYAVIGEPDGDGGWGARIYYKPLLPWIWAGALLMFLGGMLSLADRRYRFGAPKRARQKTFAATSSPARASGQQAG
ncbi:MAG: heme lyase CcmF/NrfE family subunit [Sphingomonadales bacterium]